MKTIVLIPLCSVAVIGTALYMTFGGVLVQVSSTLGRLFGG